MCKLNLKSKLFIVISLVVLVVGMALLSVGLNQTVDYKNSFEVRVSINQRTAIETIRTETEKFFDDNGINAKDYAYQELGEGKILIYKFSKEVPAKVNELQAYLQSNLEGTLKATVEIDEVVTNQSEINGYIALALGIAVIAIFIYAVIMEKLAGSVATVCASLLSGLLFISLISITRIPAYPFVGVTTALAVALGAGMSVSTINRLNEEYKNSANKNSTFEIAEKVGKAECLKYLFTAIILLVVSATISAFFVPYMMIVGGQIALAGICALAVSYLGAPLLWAVIKGKKA
jgi:hypothetical protein